MGCKALGLDEIADDLAREKPQHGVELARAAGFEADGRVARGKTWRAICDCADELDAAAIAISARGLSRVRSALLGRITAHAGRPVRVVAPIGRRPPTRHAYPELAESLACRARHETMFSAARSACSASAPRTSA